METERRQNDLAIMESLGRIESTCDSIKEDVADHETRIRSGEKKDNVQYGVMAVVAVVAFTLFGIRM